MDREGRAPGSFMTQATLPAARPGAAPGSLYYRHTLAVRIMHWVNVLALTVLFMSGLNIFDAHPALYWGKSSYTARPPVLEIGAAERGERGVVGITRVLGREFETTGVLGVARSRNGMLEARSFPWWLTIPGFRWLAMARAWHFFFAWVFVINGLCYLAWSLWSRHLARDLWPSRNELRGIGRSVVDHLRLRHPTGEKATRYNVLQKLAYLVVILVLLPLMVATGLAMSPDANALFAGWVDLFGGRQSARTLHFVFAWLIVAFVLVHVFQVIVTGLFNNLRSMITGHHRIPAEAGHD
jgi:thiosulfate reductase cytochrome b subunit